MVLFGLTTAISVAVSVPQAGGRLPQSDRAAPLSTTEQAASPIPIPRPGPVIVAITPPTAVAEGPDRDIIVQARPRATPADPLVELNVKTFAATQAVDEAIVAPVASAYQHTMPEQLRDGLRNFLNNTHEPVVFLNFLVQHKPGKAVETFARFAINTTFGVAGVFDVAKKRPFNLKRRPNGLADTLGFYGVKPGPFLFLPLVGPTTVRDAVGGIVDRLLLPLALGSPFNQLAYTTSTGALSALDRRIAFDQQLTAIRNGTTNQYTARRQLYLETRQAEIDDLRGRHTAKTHPMTGSLSPSTDSKNSWVPGASPQPEPQPSIINPAFANEGGETR